MSSTTSSTMPSTSSRAPLLSASAFALGVAALLLSNPHASASPENPEAARDGMATHAAHVDAAWDALIAGKLDRVHTVATAWIDAGPDDSDDDTLLDARSALKGGWATLAETRSVREAGAALAAIGDTCGACHVAREVAQSLEPAAAPRSAAPMARHDAGARGMWTGLVTRDSKAFSAGARQIAASNLAPEGPDGAMGTASEKVAQTLEAEVQDLAARAARSEDWSKRSTLTGAMLGACATCHQATKGGPEGSGTPALPPGALLISDMHERYGALQQARTAIGLGDLKEARRQGDRIVTLDPPSGLPMTPWRPWVADVKARATDLAHAKTMKDAAIATVAVAEACGTCHRQVDGGPRVPDDDELGATLTAEDRDWLAHLAGQVESSPEQRAALVDSLLR